MTEVRHKRDRDVRGDEKLCTYNSATGSCHVCVLCVCHVCVLCVCHVCVLCVSYETVPRGRDGTYTFNSTVYCILYKTFLGSIHLTFDI